MSLGHGPKISTDGLVFAYDMGDPLIVHNNPRAGKSWRGKPMTNATSNWATYSNWNNSGTATWNNDDTTIPRLHPDFPVCSMVKGDAGNSHISTGYGAISSGNYTSSVWVYIPTSNGASIAGSNPYFRSFPANTSRGTLYSKDGDTGFNVPRNKWVRISATWNNTVGDTSMYISCYLNNTGDKIYFTMPQLEANDFVTPHINAQIGSATRSNTQALLDWTSNNTITVNSSVVYNSDGTFSFDGTNFNSYASIPSQNLNNCDYTVEAWFNPSAVNRRQGIIGDLQYNWWRFNITSGNNVNVGHKESDSLGGPNITGSTTITANTWWHAVMTFNTVSGMKLYINGELDASTTNIQPFTITNRGPQYIGHYRGGAPTSADVFQGKIGSIKIYKNKELSANEVRRNFASARGRYGL